MRGTHWSRAGYLLLLLAILQVSGCTVLGDPNIAAKNPDSLCAIFKQRPQWRSDLRRAWQNSDSPMWVIAAFIYQESRFKPEATHPTQKPNSDGAYGYSQAIRSTWDLYRKDTGHKNARRDDFSDSARFVGWYNKKAHKKLSIQHGDARRLYLAYHEGMTGYEKKSYNRPKHAWIKGVARKVAKRAEKYRAEYQLCTG